MTPQQIEDVFDSFGFKPLFQHIRYPLELSKIFEDADEEMLECFLERWDFPVRLSFEEFAYWFDCFAVVYKQM
ncbi:hypothetical protein ACFOU2_21075 [Bacillus songklensis]|uniref:Uncharacterized protein n=1 Tax=Bacillus songklensis TaxID=1069116 RepID=A0ABV8B6B1_9BACI